MAQNIASEEEHLPPLLVMGDDQGHAMAKKIYERYIKQEKGNLSRLPSFLIALDKLVSEFSGSPIPNADEETHAEDEDEDEGDQEETSSMSLSEVDEVRSAVVAALRQR